MLSLQPRSPLAVPVPCRPTRNLSFQRLRRPTPLPSLARPFASESLAERLLTMLRLVRR